MDITIIHFFLRLKSALQMQGVQHIFGVSMAILRNLEGIGPTSQTSTCCGLEWTFESYSSQIWKVIESNHFLYVSYKKKVLHF